MINTRRNEAVCGDRADGYEVGGVVLGSVVREEPFSGGGVACK